jgi:hypothetical protein
MLSFLFVLSFIVRIVYLRHSRACHWTQKFAGSDPAEDDGYLGETKILSTTSFLGKVEPLAPCRKILRHVKDSYRV